MNNLSNKIVNNYLNTITIHLRILKNQMAKN